MFAIVKDNQIWRTVNSGQAFTLPDGTQCGADFMSLTSPEEKQRFGIVDVIFDTRPDDRFYWVNQNDPELVGDIARVTFSAIPKELSQLKLMMKKQVDSAAFSILVQTDYMDSRKNNDPNYIAPAVWLAWRAEVRNTATEIKKNISGADNVEALMRISIRFPNDPDVVAEQSAHLDDVTNSLVA